MVRGHIFCLIPRYIGTQLDVARMTKNIKPVIPACPESDGIGITLKRLELPDSPIYRDLAGSSPVPYGTGQARMTILSSAQHSTT